MHAVRKIQLAAHPTILLGYVVSVIMVVVGSLVLAGFFLHKGVPDQFRIMFGVVFALMGVYRFVLTRARQLSIAREKDDDEA